MLLLEVRGRECPHLTLELKVYDAEKPARVYSRSPQNSVNGSSRD